MIELLLIHKQRHALYITRIKLQVQIAFELKTNSL